VNVPPNGHPDGPEDRVDLELASPREVEKGYQVVFPLESDVRFSDEANALLQQIAAAELTELAVEAQRLANSESKKLRFEVKSSHIRQAQGIFRRKRSEGGSRSAYVREFAMLGAGYGLALATTDAVGTTAIAGILLASFFAYVVAVKRL
jgi:hypothetical protein